MYHPADVDVVRIQFLKIYSVGGFAPSLVICRTQPSVPCCKISCNRAALIRLSKKRGPQREHEQDKSPSFSNLILMVTSPLVCCILSQKDKDHYNILTHIYGISKDVKDNSIRRTEKETQIYRTVI